MTKVAAIDCGTNSIRLLIAQRQADATGVPRLVDIKRRMEIVRLGEGVDQTGYLCEKALARTFAMLKEFQADCDSAGVDTIRMVATSATRDALNAAEFIRGVESLIGVKPEVISGEKEAELTFRGALYSLPPLPEPALVVDIGGGSTELSFGTNESLQEKASLDMGCVRVAERFFQPHQDQSGEVQETGVRGAMEMTEDLISSLGNTLDLSRVEALVGTGGTITTITALALDLESYQPEKIHGARLRPAEILRACEKLTYSSRQFRQSHPVIHAGRQDVIAAGALVWAQLLCKIAAARSMSGLALPPVVTSECDILDGIALEAAGI